MQIGKIVELPDQPMKPLRPIVAPAISPTLSAQLDTLFGHPRTDKRPTWDEYYSRLAQLVSTRATCPRASVGCVLVRDKRLLVSGYNGSCSGLPSCLEVGCMMIDGHCHRSIHAEQNAIIQAALHGITTAGATAYVTHYPCSLCAKMLINAGVVRVVFINEYAPADGGEFFRQAGVNVERILL